MEKSPSENMPVGWGERTQSLQAWHGAAGSAQVLFLGKPSDEALPWERRFDAVLPTGTDLAWAQQVHGATVLEAKPGKVGQGDALVSHRPGMALVVVTADCVPVLLASPANASTGLAGIAAVHAGWRGLVGGVIPAAVERLAPTDTSQITAWIGPAIGRCCYEVGPEVASEVVAASAPRVETDGPRGRPHLDLVAAAEIQLRDAGVTRVERLGPCTACTVEGLWSYRRDQPYAGRNLAVIWR